MKSPKIGIDRWDFLQSAASLSALLAMPSLPAHLLPKRFIIVMLLLLQGDLHVRFATRR